MYNVYITFQKKNTEKHISYIYIASHYCNIFYND